MMIIKVNRTCVLIVLSIIVFSSLAGLYVANQNAVNAITFSLSTDIPILIDAGHGGEDGGAVAEDGTMEKNLNLDIACRLRDIFELAGYTVLMTRELDQSLSGNGFNKNEDMRARIQLAQEHPDGLFISIHLNKFSIEKYSGAQIFYSSNNLQSIPLAQAIQQSIHINLQPDNERQIKLGDENSILLRRIHNPAVIVEGGFLSNPAELSKLKTEEYRSKLAYCIFLGVIAYQQETDVS